MHISENWRKKTSLSLLCSLSHGMPIVMSHQSGVTEDDRLVRLPPTIVKALESLGQYGIGSPVAGKEEFVLTPKYPHARAHASLKVRQVADLQTSTDAQLPRSMPYPGAEATSLSVPETKIHKRPGYLSNLADDDLRIRSASLLTVESPNQAPSMLVSLHMSCDDELWATLDYIRFWLVDDNNDEIVINNDRQAVPWKIGIRYRKADKSWNLRYNGSIGGINVFRALMILRFHHLMSKGGLLGIKHLDSDLVIEEAIVPSGRTEPPPAHWLALLEKLVFIQSKTGIPLVLPKDGSVSDDQVRRILDVAKKIETGRTLIRAESWTVGSDLVLAENVLAAFGSGEPLAMLIETDETYTVLDTTIPMGASRIYCAKTQITPEDLDTLRQAIATAQAEDTIYVTFRPVEDSPLEMIYRNWVSRDSIDQSPTE